MRLFTLLILILPSLSFSQTLGLQGPFVPMKVESVHTNGNVADVQMLFQAPTSNGGTVYSQSTVQMDSQQMQDQALNKIDDPNGDGLQQQLSDMGLEPNGSGDAFRNPEEGPPEYDETFGAACGGDPNVNLNQCIDDTNAYSPSMDEVDPGSQTWYSFVEVRCNQNGTNSLELRYSVNPPSGSPFETTRIVWYPPADQVICDGSNPGALPDAGQPQGPDFDTDELPKYFAGDDGSGLPPPPLAGAPNPPSPGTPPPMYNPDFYRESDSPSFDLDMPTTPTLRSISEAMTLAYESATSTTTQTGTSGSPTTLPAGMTYSEPPSDNPNLSSGYGGSANLSSGGGGETVVNVDVENICETNPDAFACVSTSVGDEVVPTISPDTVDAGASFSPIVLSAASGCPAPMSMSFMGDTFDISYEMLCNVGPQASPLILLLASVSAAMIILGVRGKA